MHPTRRKQGKNQEAHGKWNYFYNRWYFDKARNTVAVDRLPSRRR